MAKLNFTVTKEQTSAFAKAWDKSGIKILLDDAAITFACDWANIVLKSFVADMAAQVKRVAEAKLEAQKTVTPTDAVLTQTVPAPVPSKSRIILTD